MRKLSIILCLIIAFTFSSCQKQRNIVYYSGTDVPSFSNYCGSKGEQRQGNTFEYYRYEDISASQVEHYIRDMVDNYGFERLPENDLGVIALKNSKYGLLIDDKVENRVDIIIEPLPI